MSEAQHSRALGCHQLSQGTTHSRHAVGCECEWKVAARPHAAWRGARGLVPHYMQQLQAQKPPVSTPTRLAPKNRLKQRYPTAFTRPSSAPAVVMNVEVVPKVPKPLKRKVVVRAPPPPPPVVAFQVRNPGQPLLGCC